jgi:hypothetical protein
MDCPKMEECALFPLFSKKAFLRVWQINYCEGEFTKCARYQSSQVGQAVPSSLLPNGKHLPIAGSSPKG